MILQMSEYNSERSDRSSNRDEQEHDYASDVTSTVSKELNDRYQDLLFEKYNTIMMFNKGELSVEQYMIKMGQLSREIHENEFDRDNIEAKIIEQEIELQTLLQMYEQRIKEQIPFLPRERAEWTYRPGEYKRYQPREILTEQEVAEMNRIRNQIEKLKNDFMGIEEHEDEPLPSNKLYDEWRTLSQEEQQHLQRLSGIPPVLRENYASLEEYEQAMENFLESINIFFNSYWEHFEYQEEKEIKTALKKRGIHLAGKRSKPLLRSHQIYGGRAFLPYGYTLGPGIRKNLDNWEKVDTRSLSERIQESIYQQEDIAIPLKPDEQEYSDKINKMKKILNKLTDEQLRKCIAGRYTGPIKQDTVKNLTPESRVLYQKLDKYNRPKPIKHHIILGTTPVIDKTREVSRRRLIKTFTNVPAGLKTYVTQSGEIVDNVKYTMELLEDYIFRMLKSLPPEVYFEKIDEVIFVFENYPEFKTLLLQGYIDIYRVALFTNVMRYRDKTYVYPVNIAVRKQVIQRLVKEIFFNTYNAQRLRMSEILTKILITKKARQLERFIFDLAVNSRDYNTKIKQLFQFIKKFGKQIFMPLEQLLQEVYTPKQKIHPSKECPICTFPLSMEKTVCMLFPCKHYFHCDCIKPHLDENKKHLNFCPICKTSVDYKLNKSSYSFLTEADYRKMKLNYEQMTALVLQEQYRIQELEESKRRLESKNYEEKYVVFWKPPVNLLNKDELEKWNKVLHNLELLFVKQPLSENDKLLIDNYIFNLNSQRQFLIKKYKLDFIPGLEEIKKNIKQTEEKYLVLDKLRLELLQQELNRQRSLNPPIPVEPTVIENVDYTYPLINESIITEFVNALKRVILNADTNLVELYDINQLNKKQPYYSKVNEFILKRLTGTEAVLASRPGKKEKITDFTIFNNQAIKKALEIIFQKINYEYEITTPTAAIKQLTQVFPRQWNREVLNDIHGNNLFQKLFKVNGQFEFYDSDSLMEYSKIVQQFKPGEKYLRPQAYFDNKWYNVEYLDKDIGTGKPLTMVKPELVKNPRTKMFEVVNRVSVKKGRYPFIHRQVRTAQEGELMDVWTEVLQGQIKYRTPDFGKRKKKF